MFARFKYDLYDDEFDLSEYMKEGKDIFNSHRKSVKKKLDEYIRADGSLDAAELEDDWFPAIDAQVFISHSHADEGQVKAFAGWLKKNYGITSFIDSTVWGYANDLLREMDARYSRDKNNKLSYELIIQSSAHIHMLLQGALAKMINKCECLIFVNSPNSMRPKDIEDGDMTGSPWIYSEILMADTFPPRALEEHRVQSIQESVQHFSMAMSYPLDLNDFKVIEKKDIVAAAKRISVSSYSSREKSERVLDQLYIDMGLLSRKTFAI